MRRGGRRCAPRDRTHTPRCPELRLLLLLLRAVRRRAHFPPPNPGGKFQFPVGQALRKLVSVPGMSKQSRRPRPVQLRNLLGGMALALALLLPAASASAWVKEAAPVQDGSIFQPEASMTVLPDGTARYLARGAAVEGKQTNRLVVRPPAGPSAFAAPFPAAIGQDDGFTGFLFLSPPDGSGNQLVVRKTSPFGVGFLSAAGDTAAVVPQPTHQITQVDVAPNGSAAAIVSNNSEASLRFRLPGAGSSFDAPRTLDRAGNNRSYGVAVTVDPDGGVFVIYRTEEAASLLQAYAPPGEDFKAPEPIDVDSLTLNLTAFRYGQSSDGHGVFAWDESTGGDTNSEEAWAMTRAPGGLLGDKKPIATARAGGLVAVTGAGATDDGSSYVTYLDSGPISCSNNYRFGGSVLAVKSAAGEWTKLNEPTTGNARGTIEAISTSGNAVGVLTSRLAYPSDICTDKDPTSTLEVQLGAGASLGAAQTVASENITAGGSSTIVRPVGFAVNASSAAALLVNEPQSAANNSLPFLYYEGGAPVTPPPPPAKGTEPPKAPGKIKLSGKRLIVRASKTAFETSCVRLPSEGSKLFCTVGADLLLEQKPGGGKAKSSAAKGKVKQKAIASAKPVKVLVGKTGKVTLKLNKLGKQKLGAAKRAGLKVTLKVTIKRAGYATNTIEKKVKLVAGKAKGKSNK